jgi:hypothetical protein
MSYLHATQNPALKIISKLSCFHALCVEFIKNRPWRRVDLIFGKGLSVGMAGAFTFSAK